MRKSLGLAALLLAAPAFADRDKPPGRLEEPAYMRRPAGPFGEGFVEKLKVRVGLSADQEKKIKEVLDKAKPEMDKLQEEQKALHEKIAANRRQTMESIRETLTLEQKEKFDGMRMAQPAGGVPPQRGEGGRGDGPRGDGPRGDGPPERERGGD